MVAELWVAATCELWWLHEHEKAKIWVSPCCCYSKVGNNAPCGKYMNVKEEVDFLHQHSILIYIPFPYERFKESPQIFYYCKI